MARILFVSSPPPSKQFDFYTLASILQDDGHQVKIVWWVTQTDDWTKVDKDLHQWSYTSTQVQEYSPNLVIFNGDRISKIPTDLMESLQTSGVTFIYINAVPSFSWSSDKQETAEAYKKVRFPFAINKAAMKLPGEIGIWLQIRIHQR